MSIVSYIYFVMAGSKVAKICKQNVRLTLVKLPPKELMIASTEKVVPLYTQITANLHQTRNLATLYGTLLPELLNKELKTATGFEDTGIVA